MSIRGIPELRITGLDRNSRIRRNFEWIMFCIPPLVTPISTLFSWKIPLLCLTVDTRDPHFSVVDQLLVDLGGPSVISFFGTASEVEIPASIQFLNMESFSCLHSMITVVFSAGSQARNIGDGAFRCCPVLRSVYIPKYVEILSESRFPSCPLVSIVGFEPNSKLSTIGDRSFHKCSPLASICVPRSAPTIREAGFGNCTA